MGAGMMAMIPPAFRSLSYGMNWADPNLARDPSSLIAARLRGEISDEFFHYTMRVQGFCKAAADGLFSLTKRLQDGIELITLERRGEIKREAVDERAALVGWQPDEIKELYKLTEVIPSAGDIIRYAVREVYTPEIAKAFGQFNELGVTPGQIDGVLSGAILEPTLDPEGVLAKAESDIVAAGLPLRTFTKEWAAHWLLPSIMQGFEMLHRGVIPFKSTPETPLSLERLMIALDIMPAWRDPLKAISYAPYTRVDVRRMHKIGVLDDEAVFTAYADVGFSPFAPDCEHATVAEAFACEKCRYESKSGRMLEFTLLYNAEPPQAEETAADEVKAKERDLTKSDILTGLRDGLLDEKEVTTALTTLGYDEAEVSYYLARVDFQKDADERDFTVSNLHAGYIKGVFSFGEVTDELGQLNLPAAMTDYYLKLWDLEKLARINKPTKAELMTFLRKEIIDKEIWHAEMVGLGYPNRYIDWYAATV